MVGGMSRRQRAMLSRAVCYLFAINALSLALYHLLHPNPTPPPPRPPPTPRPPQAYPSLKPWPHLPSLLPWPLSSSPPTVGSCEALFGHGFSLPLPLVRGDTSWLRCHYSETLRSSICEGSGLRMDPRKISMSRGGETLEHVLGRTEEEEMPRYEPGAFQIEGSGGGGQEGFGGGRVVDAEFLNRYVPAGGVHMHPMRALLESMRSVGPGELQCSQWIDEPTVLVTRFEYANLFHTVTDWYSAYVSSRVTGLSSRPHLVFIDGHCKAPLEVTWEELFSSIRYAKDFSGPICFRHAILSPIGYETAMFKGLSQSFSCQGDSARVLRENPDDTKTARLSEFGEMLRASFGLLPDDDSLSKPSGSHNVLFVRREDYLAHPRHSGKVESRLSNEEEVFNALKNWASGQKKCKINMVNGLLAHMHMKEQLRNVQEASVIIGAHGAGLTHLVAATPNTVALEIISSYYRRPHFSLISQWKGLEYHAINLAGSYAKPATVIDKLSSIMRSLGC